MKRIILLSLTVFCCSHLKAQNVSINASGDPADPSAILDITSMSKGVLVPRMESWQRMAIPNPAQALLVFDTNTRSFWFYSNSWNEIANGGGMNGPAFGDLSGNYPSPNVAKIQNLDVAFGVPFDKQVLKWDAVNNNWKGRNDSLFLPYNVTFSNNTSLFGITNNSTSNGASAIYGKRGGTGAGITPAATMGVWGDNSNGVGVMGTSNTGVGTYGFSFVNHGVYGYSTTANFAGVKGSHANAGGIGVMGEVQNSGYALLGLSTGTTGKAGSFQNTNSSSSDSTLTVSTPGLGLLSQFNISNTSNNKAAVDITHAGIGPGLKVKLSKVTSNANGVDAVTQGTGNAVYGRSENGTGARFENTNTSNTFPALSLGNNGLGSTLFISSSNTGQTGNVVSVTNAGSGFGLSIASTVGTSGLFSVTDINSTHSVLIAQQSGSGKGVEVNLSKPGNVNAGLYVNTLGTLGIDAFSAANNGIAIKGTTATNSNSSIGVLGQAGSSDPNGIGVKGIAGGGISGGVGVLGIANEANPQAIAVKGIGYTHNEDVGSVTGINMTDGVGVLGESLGIDGIGVAGIVGNTSNHSVAAMFKNNYNNNNRAVVEILTNGKGNGIYLDHDHLTNTSPLFRMRNAGNGQFLRFENGLGDIKTTLSKEGNLTTDGTVTVKGDKGIVRNSSSTQLRMEIVTANIPAGLVNHYDEFNAPAYIEIDFGTAFSSAPAVSLGNVVTGGIGLLTLTIEDVTTTGCTIILWNYTSHDWNYPATTYKLIVVGAE